MFQKMPSHFSNISLSSPGQGLMYGTSVGDLKIVVPHGLDDRPTSLFPTGDFYFSAKVSNIQILVHLERIRVNPAVLNSRGDRTRASLRLSAQLNQLREANRARTQRQERQPSTRPQRQPERQREWNSLRRPNLLPNNEVIWSAGRTGRARM